MLLDESNGEPSLEEHIAAKAENVHAGNIGAGSAGRKKGAAEKTVFKP